MKHDTSAAGQHAEPAGNGGNAQCCGQLDQMPDVHA